MKIPKQYTEKPSAETYDIALKHINRYFKEIHDMFGAPAVVLTKEQRYTFHYVLTILSNLPLETVFNDIEEIENLKK